MGGRTPKQYKEGRDVSGLGKAKSARLEDEPGDIKLEYKGGVCGALPEPVPSYIQAPCEKVLSGANNSWIVFGRDRLESRLSGYGGKGDTQAGSIDIVVGRMSSEAKSFWEDGERVWCDPNVTMDAARIYISQKTDIDDNFLLCDGKVGNSKTKSGIALKADGIRLVAREGIKLVTRTDGMNSQGGEIAEAAGIDLLATNNDEELQPIPKGDNLKESLEQLTAHVDKLNGIVDSLLMYQTAFNEALTHHTHIAPLQLIPAPNGVGFVWETAPSMPVMAKGMKTMIDHLSQTKRSLMTHKTNLGLYKFKYFNPAGEKYINSRYNNTT